MGVEPTRPFGQLAFETSAAAVYRLASPVRSSIHLPWLQCNSLLTHPYGRLGVLICAESPGFEPGAPFEALSFQDRSSRLYNSPFPRFRGLIANLAIKD